MLLGATVPPQLNNTFILIKLAHVQSEIASSSASGVNERKHRQRHATIAAHIVVEGGFAFILILEPQRWEASMTEVLC